MDFVKTMRVGSTILAFVGLIAALTGAWMISLSNYGLPPLPTGWIFAMVLLTVGSSIVVSGATLIFHAKLSDRMMYLLNIIFGCVILGLGIRTMLLHPLELDNCPCAPSFYGPTCLPCPCVNGGICDDGGEGSGACLCQLGFAGEFCEVCDVGFEGDDCDRCKRGFWKPEEGCRECYPGYADSASGACNVCAPNWLSETDSLGLLCRYCQPDFYGPFCRGYGNDTKCKEDGDTTAFARTNEWHRNNVYTGASCTPEGVVCSDHYDCANSYNCQGTCQSDDVTNGQLCTMDLECPANYTCQAKTCCLEQRLGNGHCECGRQGYRFDGSTCAKCPGFDGVYSASICNGHGTCAVAYADSDDIVGLRCLCGRLDTEPMPTWSGPTCSCLIESEDGPCVECSDGSFGDTCESCAGGSGISQCRGHGICNDGIDGNGQCTCDIDIRAKGLGAYAGAGCDACLSDDFYGAQCQTCPLFQTVGCSEGLNAITGNTCSISCGAQSCNVQSGYCE